MDGTIKEYATRGDASWNEAHRTLTPFTSGAVCDENDIVYEIELLECKADEKWDFIGFRYDERVGGDGGVDLVWPNKEDFELCFSVGSAQEVERRRGEVVYMQMINEHALGKAGKLGRDSGKPGSGTPGKGASNKTKSKKADPQKPKQNRKGKRKK